MMTGVLFVHKENNRLSWRCNIRTRPTRFMPSILLQWFLNKNVKHTGTIKTHEIQGQNKTREHALTFHRRSHWSASFLSHVLWGWVPTKCHHPIRLIIQKLSCWQTNTQRDSVEKRTSLRYATPVENKMHYIGLRVQTYTYRYSLLFRQSLFLHSL